MKWIVDQVFDPGSGLVIPTVVQRGENTGIRRSLKVTRDVTQNQYGGAPLRNGQEYYFAVTAYNYSPHLQALPRSMESALKLLRVKPKVPFGIKLHSKYGDTLKVNHPQGRSTGAVYPIVVNPMLGTGDTYEVRFDTSRGIIRWYVRNATKGTNVITGQTNQSGDDNYLTLEAGVLLKVIDQPPGLKRDDLYSTTDRNRWGWEWSGSPRLVGWELEEQQAGTRLGRIYGDGKMVVKSDQLKTVEIRFAPTRDNQGNFDASHPDVSYAYRYGRWFYNPPAQPQFAPFIVNRDSGYAYQDYTPSVPLAVYDVESSPPRRLAVGFLENNASGGMVDGKYWPPLITTDNVSPTGPREWLFIFDSEYTVATPNLVLQAELINGSAPVMYMATWGRYTNELWPSGGILRLYPNRPNSVLDVFTYTVPAPTTSLEMKKESAKRVGVFPNPYVAGRSQESDPSRRFVTFNNLPPKAVIRIFNLAGHIVRVLSKDNPTQFLEWDLTNSDNWQVASGMYICHVEMPEINEVKILKLAVVQAQFFPPRY